jgi:hypothetical protein
VISPRILGCERAYARSHPKMRPSSPRRAPGQAGKYQRALGIPVAEESRVFLVAVSFENKKTQRFTKVPRISVFFEQEFLSHNRLSHRNRHTFTVKLLDLHLGGHQGWRKVQLDAQRFRHDGLAVGFDGRFQVR